MQLYSTSAHNTVAAAAAAAGAGAAAANYEC